jgi:hypothetical protein
MDVGSGINLIYARTFKAMNIYLNFLQPTDFSFHEIVPGSANYPLGKIELDVSSAINTTFDGLSMVLLNLSLIDFQDFSPMCWIQSYLLLNSTKLKIKELCSSYPFQNKLMMNLISCHCKWLHALFLWTGIFGVMIGEILLLLSDIISIFMLTFRLCQLSSGFGSRVV